MTKCRENFCITSLSHLSCLSVIIRHRSRVLFVKDFFFNQEWKERGLKLKLNGNVRRISLFRRNSIVILSSCCHSYRIIP